MRLFYLFRKCRHPNIILLMGLYPDIHGNVHIICERCIDSIFGILHVQVRNNKKLKIKLTNPYSVSLRSCICNPLKQVNGYNNESSREMDCRLI